MVFERIAVRIDQAAPEVALFGSLAFHLAFLLFFSLAKNQSPPHEKVIPKAVSRVRILANPHGSPIAQVAASVEITQSKPSPAAKPKRSAPVKSKTKPKPKAKSKSARALAHKHKAQPAPGASASAAAPRSLGDNQKIGVVGTGISNTTEKSDPGINSNWQPLEQVKPKMPREAALRGIEGFIRFSFDIREDGRVENIRVVEAENRSIFETEARRAVRNFRYAPRKVNGKAVKVLDHSFTVVFKLTH